MAAAVAPAALFALGLSLVGHKLIGNVGEVIWFAVLKTVVNPILTFLLVTYVFAMDPLWSQAAVILSAIPVAVDALRHRSAIQRVLQDRVVSYRHVNGYVDSHDFLLAHLVRGWLSEDA